MPLHEKKPGDSPAGATRLQIVGPPYGMKTTVAGWLAKEGPTTIVGLPGERHTDILTPTENLQILLFDPIPVTDEKYDYEKLWLEIRTETARILRETKSKHVVFDGAHKAFEVCRKAGEALSIKKGNDYLKWQWTPDEFLKWFNQGIDSKVEWVFWLAWSAREQAVGDAKRKSIYPDYMGKMQQTIVGEMNIIYQTVEGGRPKWQLRQTEDAMGIGIRTAPEKAEKLPVSIPADWKKLKEILQG